MRYFNEEQRKAIFANLRRKMMEPEFARTVTIQSGAPYPYSAQEVQRLREQEANRYSSTDSFLENVAEAGVGATIGGLAGGYLSAKPGGLVSNVGYPTLGGGAVGTLVGGPFGTLPGAAIGGAYGIYKNYPLAIPGAIAGGLMFPMMFAKKPNQFSKWIDDKPNDFRRNEFVLYGGKTVERLRAEEAQQQQQQPHVIVIQSPQAYAPPPSGDRSAVGATAGFGMGAATGAKLAIALGQVPPFTVLPEEIITIPIGLVGGALGAKFLR